MPTAYDEAATQLFQSPLEQFVAERKRLAQELKASGDREGAARFAKLTRPSVSAWAVNQLYWHERKLLSELFALAARLQQGDYDARAEHREVSAELRSRASKLLSAAGHNPNEATLRRVSATLGALAAAGGFEPDLPGALSNDRDPPGFEAWGGDGSLPEKKPAVAKPAETKHEKAQREAEQATLDAEQAAFAKQKAAREAERAAREAEKAAREAAQKRERERKRLETELAGVKRDVDARAHTVKRLRTELSAAEQRVSEAETAARSLEDELAALESTAN